MLYFLISLPLVVYGSIFLHELGHVICARLVGAVPTSFGLGRGRVFFVCSLGGPRFYLGATGSTAGITFWLLPQLLPSRWRMIISLSGGILANGVCAGIAYMTMRYWPNMAMYALAVMAINLFYAISAAVPMSVRVGSAVLPTDGSAILLTWLGRRTSTPADTLRSVEQLTPLLRAIGDLRCLRVYLVQASRIWCDIGDTLRARELLAEAQGIPIEPLPPHRAYETLLRASIAKAEGDLASAESFWRQAEQDYAQLRHEEGQLLCDLVRGGLVLRGGNAEAAAAYYEQLSAHPRLRSHVVRSEQYRRRLHECQRAFREGNGLEAVLAAHEAMPARLQSPLGDLMTYRMVARIYTRSGKNALAAPLYVRALEAIRALDKTFAKADQERFRLAQVDLVAEAREVFRSNGQEKEAAQLETLFPSREQAEKEENCARERVEKLWRRRLRWGLLLSLWNFAVLVAVAVLAIFVRRNLRDIVAWRHEHLAGYIDPLLPLAIDVFVVFLIVCVGFCFLFGLPLAVVSWWVPRVRRTAATLLLILAAMPWLGSPITFVIVVMNRYR